MDEYFNPQCQPGEILLMRSAFYGRMNVGRCLPTDYGNMGCQANVFSVLDETCTEKQKCNVLWLISVLLLKMVVLKDN